MSPARLLLLVLLTYLAVFVQAGWDLPRQWLGSNLSLVPALLAYAALRVDLVGVTVLSLAGGLWLDSLSANPLGASIMPLYLTGWLLWRRRELLLREVDYAQLVLGAGASVLVPVLTLLVVLSKGASPDLGWQTLWQLLVLGTSGGLLTPLVFRLLDRLERLFLHPAAVPTPFRPDREIRRGRY